MFSCLEGHFSNGIGGLDAQNSSLQAIFGLNVSKTRVLRPSMILVFNLLSAWVSKPLVFKHFWAWRPLFLQNWRPECSELESGGPVRIRRVPNWPKQPWFCRTVGLQGPDSDPGLARPVEGGQTPLVNGPLRASGLPALVEEPRCLWEAGLSSALGSDVASQGQAPPSRSGLPTRCRLLSGGPKWLVAKGSPGSWPKISISSLFQHSDLREHF